VEAYRIAADENGPHTHTIYYDENYCPVRTGVINNDWKQALTLPKDKKTPFGMKWESEIGYDGIGSPHENMQPAVACYSWFRTE